MNNTELDSFPVPSLVDRYGLKGISNIYNRLTKLEIKPEKIAGKSYLNGEQLALMDALDQHLKSGGGFADFGIPTAPIGNSQDSYRNLEQSAIAKPKPSEQLVTAHQLLQVLETISQAIAAPPQLPPVPSAHPLENIRRIQEAHDRQWKLSTSQVALLLGLKSVSGSEIKRYGFVFTRSGKNGSESAWSISKDR